MNSAAKKLIVVLGMHRSGTSMITRALNIFGVELGENLMQPAENINQKGFFEDVEINALNVAMLKEILVDWHSLTPVTNNDIENLKSNGYFSRAVNLLRNKTENLPVFGFKDPRAAKLIPFWRQVFFYCGFDVAYVLALRNPLSVAASLAARDGFVYEKSYMLWLGHVIPSLLYTQDSKRVLIDYDHFLDNPQGGIELIAKRLMLTIDNDALHKYNVDFLDKKLQHSIYSAVDLQNDPTCPALVKSLYSSLVEACTDNEKLDSRSFHVQIETWSDELDGLRVAFSWIDRLLNQIDGLIKDIAENNKSFTGLYSEKFKDLIQLALSKDRNFFKSSFSEDWYKNKYPDVAHANVNPYQHYVDIGIFEGRLPHADIAVFIRHALATYLTEIEARIGSEQAAAQSQVLRLAEREKIFAEQLDDLRQRHEEKTGEQSQQYLSLSRAHVAELNEARNQVELQLREIAEREKGFAEQIENIQQRYEKKAGELSQQYLAREQAHVADLNGARNQVELQLREIAEREKELAKQLEDIQQRYEKKAGELNQQYLAREQAHVAELNGARNQFELQLREIAEREKEFAEQLEDIQQRCEKKAGELNQQYLAREQAHVAELNGARNQFELQLREIAEREKEFAKQLEDIQHRCEKRAGELSQQYLAREEICNKKVIAVEFEANCLAERLDEQRDAVIHIYAALNAIFESRACRWIFWLNSLGNLRKRSIATEYKNTLGLLQGLIWTPSNEKPVGQYGHSASEPVWPHSCQVPESPIEICDGSIEPEANFEKKFKINNNGNFDMNLKASVQVASTSAELLSHTDDREFIHCAYLSVLGRKPDPEGMHYYLNRLRSGISKIEILSQLRNGTEGKKRTVKIQGLDKLLRRYKQLKTPLLGPVMRLAGFGEQEMDLRISLRTIENKFSVLSLQTDGALSEINQSLVRLEKQATINFKNVTQALSNTSSVDKGIAPEKSNLNEITREEFDDEWYLSQYPDIAKAEIDPFDHYANSGKYEKRLAMRKGSGFPQIKPVADEVCASLAKEINFWPRKPVISILMPTYNTPETWLREAIESVIAQVYQEWELCIADDSSTQPHVRLVLEEYASKDSRIKVIYREENGYISAASNSALTLATGDFTALFDHDDLLERHALYHVAKCIVEEFPDIIYSDEILVNADANEIISHAFRPMFSLELLRSHPYIVHLVVFSTKLLKDIGGFDETLTISQDYDLILRAVEHAQHIVHIPIALYRWRTHESSTGHAKKTEVMQTSKKILAAHLARCKEDAEILDGKSFNFFEIRYALKRNQSVAIIIPTKNHGALVRQCIDSIVATVSGVDYDIILIDHASDDKESIQYFNEISSTHKVLRYEGDFNFSSINNWAIDQLEKNYSHYLLCNNDIEAFHDGWLNRMLELGQKSDIGIVGAKLYYPNPHTIQHAGVCVGMFGAAEHYGKFMEKCLPGNEERHPGYIGSLITNREMSAVTAACMLVRSDAFKNVRGFDEHAKVGFGDVDLCLRIREAGYRVVFCPNAELVHHESFSRGKSTTDPHPEDSAYFLNRWGSIVSKGDPYYNPNLTLFNTHWNLKRSEEFEMQTENPLGRRSFRKLLDV